MKTAELAAFSVLGAAALTVGYLILSAPEGEADWQRYVETHHCKAVAATDGSNRGGWRCDDGKVHYRWRQQK